MRSSLLLLIAAILIAPAIHAQERLQLSAGTILDVTTLAEDIAYPTSVAIAPDGSAWVSDGYTGHIWRFSPGGLRELVGTIPLTLKLNDEANYGVLFDVEVFDKDGSGTLTVMSMFTTPDDRLRIGKSEYDGMVLSAPKIVLDVANVPATLGHSMSLLEDGTLAISVGSFDNTDPSNLNVLNGKLIRMDEDGKAVTDNPGYNPQAPYSASSFVYSYGHRQLAAVAQVPTSQAGIGGRLYGVEPGARGASEINLITAGGDHGWRYVTGFCAEPTAGFVCPKATMELVPSAVAFYHSDAIPEWKSSLIVGTMSTYGGLVVADVTADGEIGNIDVTAQADNVLLLDDTRQFTFQSATGMARPKSIAVGQDGRVFMTTVEFLDGKTKGRVVVIENYAIHTPLSVNEYGMTNAGFVFGPNPMSDVLNVRLAETSSSDWNVRILDLMGRPVASQQVSSGTSAVAIQTSHLVTGTYLLVIDDGTRTRSASLMR